MDTCLNDRAGASLSHAVSEIHDRSTLHTLHSRRLHRGDQLPTAKKTNNLSEVLQRFDFWTFERASFASRPLFNLTVNSHFVNRNRKIKYKCATAQTKNSAQSVSAARKMYQKFCIRQSEGPKSGIVRKGYPQTVISESRRHWLRAACSITACIHRSHQITTQRSAAIVSPSVHHRTCFCNDASRLLPLLLLMLSGMQETNHVASSSSAAAAAAASGSTMRQTAVQYTCTYAVFFNAL